MKKLLLIIFLIIPSIANAAIYCVDGSGGSDSNTGLSGAGSDCSACDSGASPWATIGKATSSTMTCGSTGGSLCVKKGQTYQLTTGWTLPCSGVNGTLLSVTGWDTAGNWTQETTVGSNIWSITLSGIEIPWHLTLSGTEYEPAFEPKDIDIIRRWHVRPTSATATTFKLYVYAESVPSSFYASVQYRDIDKFWNYSAYGSGDDPVISCINTITGSTSTGSWTNLGSNIWSMSLTTNPNRVDIDGVDSPSADSLSGTLGTHNHPIGTTYLWYWTASVLYVYSPEGNPASFHTYKGRGDCGAMISATTKQYFKISDWDVRGGSTSVIQNRGSKDFIVEDSELGYGGYAIIHLGGSTPGFSTNKNYIFRDNVANHQQNYAKGVGYDDISGVREGHAIRTSMENAWIYRNTIKGYDHGGVHHETISQTTDFPNGVFNIWEFANDINAQGNYDGRGFSYIGSDNKLYNVELFYNIFSYLESGSKLDGGNATAGSIHVHDNIFAHASQPLFPHADYARDICEFVTYICLDSTYDSHNTLLENNVFYDNESHAVVFDQQSSSSCVKSGHVVRNNIFLDIAYAPVVAGITGVAVQLEAGSNIGANTVSNNLVYNSDGSTAYFMYGGTFQNGTRYTASGFNALDGTASSTMSGNIEGDPKFVDYPALNFQLISGSPAINAGLTTTRIVDYYGGALPKGVTDIGLNEFDSLAACGDTHLDAGEECDDGNLINYDGCSSTCTIETPVCGNGHIEAGEQCDDSNTVSGDGCSSTCQTEVVSGGTLKGKISGKGRFSGKGRIR